MEKEIILESAYTRNFLYELRAAQEPRDRLHYLEAATEAITNPASRGTFINRLYTDIVKKSDFDYGKIGNSKGNLTRYEHYSKVYGAYECLCGVQVNKTPKSLTLFKSLHDILISARPDFEMGYKFNIEFIQLTYKNLVLALHQLIDIATCEVTDYLRSSIELSGAVPKTSPYGTIVISSVKSFISLYNDGEWTKIINSFKKDRNALIGTIIATSAVAIGGIIGILVAIRGIIYLHYSTKTKLQDYAKGEAEILRFMIEQDAAKNTAASAMDKNKALLDFLERRADIRRPKLIAGDNNAEKEIERANQDNYNKKSIDNLNDPIDDGEFTLI